MSFNTHTLETATTNRVPVLRRRPSWQWLQIESAGNVMEDEQDGVVDGAGDMVTY